MTTILLKARSNLDETAREFIELVERCYKEKPDKKDLRKLKKHLDEVPSLWSSVFDLTYSVRRKILNELIAQKPADMALEKNIEEIKSAIGYDQSPMVEKLLIDNVVNSWLRLEWAELRYSHHTSGSHVMSEGEYWLRVLNSSQRRYLRAVETLARVRRITRATLQINIAEPGSQQVNIAGDVVKSRHEQPKRG